MPSARAGIDGKRLREIAAARAAVDPVFRAALVRARTAKEDPRYEEYVERKRREGEEPLKEEAWKAKVFGKEPPSQEPSQGRPSRRLERLFKPEEIDHLPDWASQQQGDEGPLFRAARVGHKEMLDWLDRGEGIDVALGASVIRLDRGDPRKQEISTEDLAPGPPVVIIAPPKHRDRARDKVRTRYGGNWQEGATDLVRGTIAVDNYEDMRRVVDKLRESGMKLVAKPRNRFAEPTEVGYRDMVLNVQLPSGHIMELQLHLKPMLRAKEEAHGHYRAIRDLQPRIQKEGRDSLTAEELAVYDRNVAAMRRIYDEAWSGARERIKELSLFDVPEHTAALRVAAVRYYDFDGLPVRWERPKLPQIHGNGDPHPVDDLAEFARLGVPISKSKFDQMVRARSGRGKAPGTRKSSLLPRLARLAATVPEFRAELREAVRAVRERSTRWD